MTLLADYCRQVGKGQVHPLLPMFRLNCRVTPPDGYSDGDEDVAMMAK